MSHIDQTQQGENLMRLKNFPVSFFSVVMGLAGFSIAWEKAAEVLHTSHYLGLEGSAFVNALAYIGAPAILMTLVVFVFLLGIYGTKLLKYPQAVAAELKHPVKLSFFPAISIGMLLLSIGLLPIASGLAEVFWIAGASLHLLFTLYVISSWMHHEHYETQHINPAWFIPAVGNVLVPIAGVALGYIEISWFFFSIGIVFWVILFTLLFNRVLFHNPLPKHLVPTFFILIAPPAVGFIAYLKLNGGQIDSFAHILYYIGLFLTLLLFFQFKQFSNLPFFLSWWAYSFPIAAITIASFLMFALTQQPFFVVVAGLLLLVLTSIIFLLLLKTVQAVMAKKICVEG